MIGFLAFLVIWTSVLCIGGFIFRAVWRRFIGPAD